MINIFVKYMQGRSIILDFIYLNCLKEYTYEIKIPL